jgi:hypothetical protein
MQVLKLLAVYLVYTWLNPVCCCNTSINSVRNSAHFKTTNTHFCFTYPVMLLGMLGIWGLCENSKQYLAECACKYVFYFIYLSHYSLVTRKMSIFTFEQTLWNAARQTPSWRICHLALLYPDWSHFCCQRNHPAM